MDSGLPGSLPSYILYYLLCIFLFWLIKVLLLCYCRFTTESALCANTQSNWANVYITEMLKILWMAIKTRTKLLLGVKGLNFINDWRYTSTTWLARVIYVVTTWADDQQSIDTSFAFHERFRDRRRPSLYAMPILIGSIGYFLPRAKCFRALFSVLINQSINQSINLIFNVA